MEAKEFGIKWACAANGVPRESLDVCTGLTSRLESSMYYKQSLCKLAAFMYDQCGQAVTLQRNVYDQLAKSAAWDPEFDVFVDCVTTAIAKSAPHIQQADKECKEASLFSKGMMANLVGRGIASTPEVVKTLAALGVGAGAGIGGLSWYLNRDSQEDDDSLEVMQARINNYHRITKELNDQLRQAGKLPVTGTPGDTLP